MVRELTYAAVTTDSRLTARPDSYDPLADEYYELNHITSRNFDAATLSYLSQFPVSLPEHGLALDLGAGRGRLAEYCGVAPARILQVDISPRMLLNPRRELALARLVGDARALPFRTGAFAIVAAFLLDPFNSRGSFTEVARVLTHGGIFLGTLPHQSWGLALRSAKGTALHEAVFLLKSGEHVRRLSILSRPEQLVEDLKNAGLRVTTIEALSLPKDVTYVSPDVEVPARLLGESAYGIPIVQLVVAIKA